MKPIGDHQYDKYWNLMETSEVEVNEGSAEIKKRPIPGNTRFWDVR